MKSNETISANLTFGFILGFSLTLAGVISLIASLITMPFAQFFNSAIGFGELALLGFMILLVTRTLIITLIKDKKYDVKINGFYTKLLFINSNALNKTN